MFTGSRTTSASSDLFASVEFGYPLSATDAADAVLSYQASIVQLIHVSRTSAVVWTGGVFPASQKNSQAVGASYRASRLTTISDQLATLASRATVIGETTAIQAQRASINAQLATLDQPEIVRVDVRATLQQLDRVRHDPRVRSVGRVQSTWTALRHNVSGRLAAPLGELPPRSDWVPDDNWVTVQPSATTGGRYVQQDFTYNAGRSAYVGFIGGLEMKFHQNNYGGLTYFDLSEDFGQIPHVQAWSSTIPCPYLDTRSGNPVQEPSFIIGSDGTCFNQFASGVWYDNYIRAYPGNSDTGTSKAYPSHEQCGNVSGPCGTWQMFQDDFCPVGFWNTPNPVLNWHWNRFTGGDGGQPGCQ